MPGPKIKRQGTFQGRNRTLLVRNVANVCWERRFNSTTSVPINSYVIFCDGSFAINGLALVQWLSHVWLFVIPWTAARQASLSFTISMNLLKFMFAEPVMASDHPILCRPLLPLPSIFPSIAGSSNELAPCIREPKFWSFSFGISPFGEFSGWISFMMGWLDLLTVQGMP